MAALFPESKSFDNLPVLGCVALGYGALFRTVGHPSSTAESQGRHSGLPKQNGRLLHQVSEDFCGQLRHWRFAQVIFLTQEIGIGPGNHKRINPFRRYVRAKRGIA